MFKIAWHPIYAHPLPENHRFPMLKYELIPQQLLLEGTIEKNQLFASDGVSEEVLQWTHDKNYIQKLKKLELNRKEERRMGFPQSLQLYQRELKITQGTIEACWHAFKDGIAFNVAGGTHHAFSNQAEGFCLYNDQAVAANYLLQQNQAKNILILDLDVHQGNGTAEIFSAKNEVYTVSMHGANNFPLKKEQSDWDIPLNDYTTGPEYLKLLREVLENLAPKNFDFIFYQSGVDVLASDQLGRLSLQIADCKKRDELVLNWANKKGIPLVACMGGGYSKDIKTIIEAHCNTYRLANFIY